jgi:hypothetical protein
VTAPVPASDEPHATGIGGIFFTSKDPKALRAWYQHHLGMPMNEHDAVFEFGDADADGRGYRVLVQAASTVPMEGRRRGLLIREQGARMGSARPNLDEARRCSFRD